MKSIEKKIVAVLFSLLFVGAAFAESRYITDIIYVPMRAGPGNQYKIIHRGIRTGTEMTVLEADAGNDFSKVVTPGGLEGYIPTQYLLKKPPARILLPDMQAKADKAVKVSEQLTTQLRDSEAEIADLKEKAKASGQELEQKQSELKKIRDISADTLAIDQRNKQLVEENQKLKNRTHVLQADNDQLVRDNSIRWYLYGGSTVVVGIFLGLLLPRIRIRKKASDWV